MAKRKRDSGRGAGPSKRHAAASTPDGELPHRNAAPAGKSKEGVDRPAAAAIITTTTTTTSSSSSSSPLSSSPWAVRDGKGGRASFQVITGSYERVLHGFVAAIPTDLVTGPDEFSTNGATDDNQPSTQAPISFSDTFLFNAHTSAIRCLALTPTSDESSKVLLATGSTDERINLYSLSTAPPAPPKPQPPLPSLHGGPITQNPKNKELGVLLHHSSSITALHFPTRSKLISSAEDSTIAITRTRDWETLSTIKAPIPKPQGRPSGDTAAPGEVPAGVTDFSIHPSMKLMISVGKGEKCMRLWNLVTGKKAGVLNFSKDILVAVDEGRFGSGEGRAVTWDAAGDEFAVAFERGVVVFGIDCKAKARMVPSPRTKVHKVRYLPSTSHPTILAVSTEDGRIMLYDTDAASAVYAGGHIPSGLLLAQIGGPAAGFTGRIKDFELLPVSNGDASIFLVFTGSSDGTVRIWCLKTKELPSKDVVSDEGNFAEKQVGRLLGTYSTGTRITCLKVFAMTGQPDGDEVEEMPNEGSSVSESESSSE